MSPLFRPPSDPNRPAGWPILSLAGIRFYIEPSFLLFVGLIFFSQLERHPKDFSAAGLLVFIIFFSLLIHEAGHAITARLFSKGQGDIIVSLVMFGGNTRHAPATRGKNLLITLAGPLSTLAIVVVAGGLLRYVPAVGDSAPGYFLASNFFFLNLFWAILNLLPIYPLDGGQILFFGLSFLLAERRALLTTAAVSMLACLAAGAWMYYRQAVDPFLIIFTIMFFMQNLQMFRALTKG